jgi:Zn-dependent M32 family carboxypeptidase
MKKALFLFLSSVMFLSCDDENGQINQLKDDFSVLGKGMSSDIVVAFEKDVKDSNIDLEIKNWEKALNKQDFDKVETYQNSIVGILNSFYEKYKKESVEDYVKLLHEIEAKVLGNS